MKIVKFCELVFNFSEIRVNSFSDIVMVDGVKRTLNDRRMDIREAS